MDMAVENYGSIVLLRAKSPVGKSWIEEYVSPHGYQPFPAGTRIVEPSYVADIVTGGRAAGLVVG
jgi:hypothetical protein